MIYKRPNIKSISTTLLLSLLWGTTLSSAAEQQIINEDNALGTQHANLPAQGTHHIAANWGEFFAAYQPNMVVTQDTKNGRLFLYQGASMQAELQSGIYDLITALYLQPDHSVYIHAHADRNKIRYVQANGIILENIQSGLSFIYDLYPQLDGSIIVWGKDDAHGVKLVHVRPGVTSWKEINTGLSGIGIVYRQPDGSFIIRGEDASGAAKLVHGRHSETNWQIIETGLRLIFDVYPQPDGSLIVIGEDAAGAAKLVHSHPYDTDWQEIETGLTIISYVYPQSDGSILVKGEDASGAAKLVHGRHSETNWQEIETGLSGIDEVYPQPDGSMILRGRDAADATKLIHGRLDGKNWQEIEMSLSSIYYIYSQPNGSIIISGCDERGHQKFIHGRLDGKNWQEIKTDLSRIYNLCSQADGSLHLSGKDAAGGFAAKYISPDGQVQPLLGQHVLDMYEFLNAERHINKTLPNLITAKDELNTASLQYLCEKLAKFRQKPKDALFLFTKLHEKLHTHFHGSLQSDDLTLPLSNKIGEDAYRAQQNLLADTLTDLREKYESTWLSPYLDALYLEYSGIRDLVYTAKEGFKPLTLDGIKAESANLEVEDPMHYKNRWNATLLADDILKNIGADAKELMQESDFKELYQHINQALTQLSLTAVSSPTPPDTSMTTTG